MLPCVVQRQQGGGLFIDVFGMKVAVDAPLDTEDPERLHHTVMCYANGSPQDCFDDVDCLFVSHACGALAVPFLTEYLGFSGAIYCTEAVREMAQLAMLALVTKPNFSATPFYNEADIANSIRRFTVLAANGVQQLNENVFANIILSASCVAANSWVLEDVGAGRSLLICTSDAPYDVAKSIGASVDVVVATTLIPDESLFVPKKLAEVVRSELHQDRLVLVDGGRLAFGAPVGALQMCASFDDCQLFPVSNFAYVTQNVNEVKEACGRLSEYIMNEAMRKDVREAHPDRPFQGTKAVRDQGGLIRRASVPFQSFDYEALQAPNHQKMCYIFSDPAALLGLSFVQKICEKISGQSTFVTGVTLLVPDTGLSPARLLEALHLPKEVEKFVSIRQVASFSPGLTETDLQALCNTLNPKHVVTNRSFTHQSAASYTLDAKVAIQLKEGERRQEGVISLKALTRTERHHSKRTRSGSLYWSVGNVKVRRRGGGFVATDTGTSHNPIGEKPPRVFGEMLPDLLQRSVSTVLCKTAEETEGEEADEANKTPLATSKVTNTAGSVNVAIPALNASITTSADHKSSSVIFTGDSKQLSQLSTVLGHTMKLV